MAATSRGIDVSSYQGPQNWAALARGGLTFVQVKASEGAHSRDEHYRMHMDGVLSVPSLLPQGYHYAWPNQDARAEADNYIDAVRSDADRHPAFVHWLDLERRPDGDNYRGASDAQIRAYAEAWTSRVRAAFPRQRVGTYTSGEDIRRGHYPRNSDALWYPAYPAGPLSYTQAEQRARPAINGLRCLFWQFTSTPTDRSICYMTPATLAAWAGHQEDDMPSADEIAKAVWNYQEPNKASGRPMRMAVGITWADYERQQAVRLLTAQVGALNATVARLAAAVGDAGGLTAEQVQSAAEAGAQAALAQLGDALTPDAPAAD